MPSCKPSLPLPLDRQFGRRFESVRASPLTVDGLTDSVEEMLLLASPTSASVASGGTRPVERVEEKALSFLV